MKPQILSITMLVLTAISCDFGKSVNVDFITGLKTRGDGLTCDEVYISDGESKINRSSFTYGETFYLNFENIKGFDKIEDAAYPGMQLFVISHEGDTVLRHFDLYEDYTDGVKIEPLVLNTNLTVADPVHSKTEYSLQVNIWDKKGKGTFHAELDFNVVPNEQISIESKDVSYSEIYLFSSESNSTIIDNTAKFNETIYMIFEGLEGFKQENGEVFIGLGIKAEDAEGVMILNEEDLIGDSGMEFSEFRSQMAPNFIVNDSNLKNPITCEIVIWDKKSEGSLKARVSLNLE